MKSDDAAHYIFLIRFSYFIKFLSVPFGRVVDCKNAYCLISKATVRIWLAVWRREAGEQGRSRRPKQEKSGRD